MLYLLFLAGLLIYFGITHDEVRAARPVHLDGMPDEVHHPDRDDATTIDRWDRPDRVPGVRVRRPRRPEGDL